jgi:glyoxylase-like metal-dependent hydrolase (beta-lactamase superfamily II)
MHFHPVGQGCFYTGTLEGENCPLAFNFVYDCGTDSDPKYLKDEIDRFRSTLIHNVIDLCIISHFDYDHIRRITRLLSGITCKRLVLPYYEPEGRLIIALNTDKVDRRYEKILHNPVGYFGSRPFDIWEIGLVGGNGDEDDNGEPRPAQGTVGGESIESNREDNDRTQRKTNSDFMATGRTVG